MSLTHFIVAQNKGFRYLSFAIGCLLLLTAPCIAEDLAGTTTVQGLGYPPIKAESAAQAHLMARRAAVIDAYRNSLRGNAKQSQGHDIRYEELSGFVSGMTILKEEYLRDGGIRITAGVPHSAVPSAAPEAGSSAVRRGPQVVTLDEWYSIINNLVRFDNNKQGGRYEKNH